MIVTLNATIWIFASTLSKVQLSWFWIAQAKCKRFNSVSIAYPKMACLPKTRVNLVKLFLHAGTDFTSHIWLNGTEGRSKTYLLICTCLNIHAWYIELMENMMMHSFILAFIWFTNMYSIPNHISSDNAIAFLAAVQSQNFYLKWVHHLVWVL